jgi:hypothetical protein
MDLFAGLLEAALGARFYNVRNQPQGKRGKSVSLSQAFLIRAEFYGRYVTRIFARGPW